MKSFKTFWGDLEQQEKWLNSMAAKGYRLVGTTRWNYIFEQCQANEYTYRVEFVADKSYKDLKDYNIFLSEMGIKAYQKNLNVGKYSYGSFRLRWFGKDGVTVATSPGTINSELLILEKKNDGKKFEVFTNNEDKINYLKKLRRTFLFAALFMIVMLVFGTPQLSLWGKDYSQYFVTISGWVSAVVLFLAILISLRVLKITRQIMNLESENKIKE